MLKKVPALPILGWVILSLLLTHCTQLSREGSSKATPAATPYTLPSDAYLGLANRQVGEERDALMIMAAGRAIYEGRVQEGADLLNRLQTLPPILASQKTILLAKIEALRDKPQAAIRRLSTVKQLAALSSFYQVQYHDLLASAYAATGSPVEALGERTLLDRLLTTQEQVSNRRVMWLILTTLPQAELNTLAAEGTVSPDLLGWLRLALIARSKDQHDLMTQLQAWQRQYPTHPGNSILHQSVLNGTFALYPKPKQVALLLPMSGPLMGPGTAVYDGFMAANQQAGEAVKVRVYDTAKAPAKQLYGTAIAEGAQFVVGPLSKPDVLEVAPMAHPVPTILLNDIDGRVAPDAYLFGLSPVNEAGQVAIKAHRQGYRRALVIAPNGAWGDEVLKGFMSPWKRHGGHIVETFRYDDTTNFTQALRDLLQYYEPPVGRDKKPLGTPSRRQDFDMIFLLAYPTKAREIMPLLRYYYIGNVPVFSTSVVYAGSPDSKLDRDLDGIIFCDMPFVFTHDLPNKHWPEQLNAYSRLYAIGMDSEALTHQLNTLLLFPAMGVDDKSGVLYLSNRDEISRILAWGQFRQGRVVKLSETV